MTQVGEGQETGEDTPSGMTFGAPAAGEVLAERYELAEHINDDSAGRQVWRGVDVVLRRPVAVVLRYPGGASATEMLQAAVAASRVVHPNLIGVYDAIDEERRAYVVREWIDGRSLRELVAEGPLDPARATSIAHAVASALAAIHATGMVHGNVHPGTVMVGDDGRVVLADARTGDADSPEHDLRAVGGILYFALTGHWPHAEARLAGGGATGKGRAALVDAVRDASGAAAAPRQIRAGVPTYLDDLTMDLLNPALEVPTSEMLAAELGRLDVPVEEPYLETAGPLRFTMGEEGGSDTPLIGNRRTVVGVAGLLVIALIGLLFGINALTNRSNGSTEAAPSATASVPASAEPSTGKPHKIKLTPDQVRVIDPDGKRDELDGVAAVIDNDMNTGWDTDSYTTAKFGNLKKGMGILISLDEPQAIKDVQVELSTPGTSVELLTGPSAPTVSTRKADRQILETFTTRIGEPYEAYEATRMSFSGFEPDQKYQYLLVWITELPATDTGRFKIGVQEITVQAP